ncbi:MAG: putative 2OG-Fe(II) oxygenase [Verrucomicrobiota bacterium]
MPIEDISIYAIPIRVVDIENHEQVLEAFSPWIKEKHPNLRSIRGWECDTKTTFGKDSRQFPFKVLRSSLGKHVQGYFEEFLRPQNGATIVEKEIWLNVYSKGDYQEIHNHLMMNTVVSVAYMLKLPSRSGSIVFYRSGDTFFRSLSDFVRPDFSRDSVTPNLREGQAVLFPSFLPHYVSPHQGDNLRATISANYDVSHPELATLGSEERKAKTGE